MRKLLVDTSELKFHNNLYNAISMRQHIEYIKKELLQYADIAKSPIGLMVEREPKLIFIMLALLELRIPFLPIQKSTPIERVEYMLQNVGVNYLISDSDIEASADMLEIDFSKKEQCFNSTDWYNNNKWGDIAYILFTSGTTGKPKAVEVKRRGLDNFIESIPQIISLKQCNCIACFTDFTFDIFFLESVLALSIGLRVVLADEDQRKNPKKMLQLIVKENVDIIQMTPSMMQMLLLYDKDSKCFSNIDIILIGGEMFPSSLLKTLQMKTNSKIYNMYGPTETTIWSSIADLTREQDVHIGYPIANTEIRVLDDEYKEVTQGELGEICIYGAGLARGYCNDIVETNKAFIVKGNTIFYRTGDIGVINKSGKLQCLGRRDNQIKFRGHRIELEEIEQVALEIVGIDDAVTCYYKSDLEERLVIFYVSEKHIDKECLFNNLKKMLPDYMLPQNLVEVNQLQYTTNGKKDRNAMLHYWIREIGDKQECEKKQNNCSYRDEIVNIIMDKAKTTENSELKVDDFVALGIDSISFVTIIVELEEKYDIEFDEDVLVVDYFKNIEEFIVFVETMIEQQE